MHSITATVPCTSPPNWAILQRALFSLMDGAIHQFLERYTRPNGYLRWPDRWHNEVEPRDGVDDFYELFSNWPLYYLLGGGDAVFEAADREWDAITEQLTRLGRVHNEYERGYDQFHQSEHYTYFYNLCLADPTNPKYRTRARRFAGLYLNEEPEAANYDPIHKLVRAPMNGSKGPNWGYFDSEPYYGDFPSMAPYGLPYHDLPGINSYADLHNPVMARRMGTAMQERMGKGDVAANLGVVSLIANAFLLTQDTRYREWIAEYVGAWLERARQNNGVIPDNVGLSGQVGEYLAGRWYGGLYGWTWPHGLYNIAYAAIVGATGALLVTNDQRFLELPRALIDNAMRLGTFRDLRSLSMSLGQHWQHPRAAVDEPREVWFVPYRYGDNGWFDEQPLSPIFPVALWNLAQQEQDRARVARLQAAEAYDWSGVFSFRIKEDAGHEQPWWSYLNGDNPAYPEQILRVALEQVYYRLARIRSDTSDFEGQTLFNRREIHHWQNHNPITTEALLQLTLGAPAPIYNGGLLIAPLRYYDAVRRRPGLPPDVAALVELVTADSLVVQLVNLSPFAQRELFVQAGGFGEHSFSHVRYTGVAAAYPDPATAVTYTVPPVQAELHELSLGATDLWVILPPATQICLEFGLQRMVHTPSYMRPWERDGRAV